MADNTQSEGFSSGDQTVGVVYAKALLGAATNANCREVVLEELDSLVDDVLKQLPRLNATLSSLRVPDEVKLGLLEKMFAGKMNGVLFTFLKVAVKNGRLNCLGAIRQESHRIDDEENGRVSAQVITAEPLADGMFEQVREGLAAKLGQEVVLTAKVDPDVIGGLVIRVGDTVYDGSLANQLERMRRQAMERSSQEIRHSQSRFSTDETTAG